MSESELRRGYYFKHNVKGLLRGSSDKRADYYTKRFYLGSLSPNDIRMLEDEDPIENENADKYYVQMNVMPLDDVDKPQEQQPQNIPGEQPVDVEVVEPEQNNIEWSQGKVKLLEYRNIAARDKISKRYHPLIKDSASLVVWREKILINRLFKNKNNIRENINNLKADIEQTYKSFGSYVYKKMSPVFHAFGDSIYNQALLEIGESVEQVPDEVVQELNRYTDVYSKRHVGSSSGQLLSLLDNIADDDIVEDVIIGRVDEWNEKRPNKIADNEAVRLANFVTTAAFFTYSYKAIWRIRGAQTCPYCQSLNGRSIKKGESFFEGGEEHEPKGAKNGPMLIRSTVMHPPLHRGCDCYISLR